MINTGMTTEENPGFLPFLPFLTLASISCAVESVHKLATRNPKTLGVIPPESQFAFTSIEPLG